MRVERADLRHERTDFRFERADLGPDRAALRLERADLRPERTGGGTHRQKNKHTNKWTKFPVFYRTLSSTGPLPKKNKARYTATKVAYSRAGQ